MLVIPFAGCGTSSTAYHEGNLNAYFAYVMTFCDHTIENSVFYRSQTSLALFYRPEGIKGLVSLERKRTRNLEVERTLLQAPPSAALPRVLVLCE